MSEGGHVKHAFNHVFGTLVCIRDPGDYQGRHRIGNYWMVTVDGFRVNGMWR